MAEQTIIQALRAFIASCPHLGVLAGDIDVDWLEESPDYYGIFPTGQTLVGEDMAGNKEWQYDAAIQMWDFTPEDENRVNNSGFMERFHAWINSFSRVGIPLPVGCDFISIRAGNGAIDEYSEDGAKGRYRIMVNLNYERMM